MRQIIFDFIGQINNKYKIKIIMVSADRKMDDFKVWKYVRLVLSHCLFCMVACLDVLTTNGGLHALWYRYKIAHEFCF